MSERMSEPERGVNRRSPEREPGRFEQQPPLPASTLIINEMEQKYLRPGLSTSEYSALRDSANFIDAEFYLIKKGRDVFSKEWITKEAFTAKSRQDAGLYGKKGEKMNVAGSYQKRLTEAFTAEGLPQDEINNNIRVVFSRTRDRLENPPSQPPSQK